MSLRLSPLRLVILESPFRGQSPDERRQNTRYARKCLMDSIARGEAPIASHLLYPQVLDEDKPGDRSLGIDLGLAWASAAEAAVFYIDRGMSFGMLHAMKHHAAVGLAIEVRRLVGRPKIAPSDTSQTAAHGGADSPASPVAHHPV